MEVAMYLANRKITALAQVGALSDPESEFDNQCGCAFNLSELVTRVDNDRELLLELMGFCKVEIPRHLTALRESVARVDLNATETSAHALTSMFLQLTALRAASAATRLEQLGCSGETAEFGCALALLESEVIGVMAKLESYVGSRR
jgi:hypothetical protein